MTAPGGDFGEGAHDDRAGSRPPGGRAFEEPTRQTAWEPPGSDHPPPAYPAGYQPGYPYQQPPGPPYPPAPPPPGYGPPPGFGPPPGYGPPPGFGPPPGYGPAPYPAGYPPLPDYHGGYWPSGDARPGTNGLAIASLLLSLTGLLCCFIGSIAGIVLGVVALSQIKRTRQGGSAMAAAGIVIGIGGLLVGLAVAAVTVHSR
ncbi:DUF4190 domain-containing protein [Mycobacterium sp. THU-M104]|uniref:DUF4190 domain-containing protein n=1 Tax=Mycobacterium sp. THU-M104 TaxID=3410515 RepID=UPI003B99323B